MHSEPWHYRAVSGQLYTTDPSPQQWLEWLQYPLDRTGGSQTQHVEKKETSYPCQDLNPNSLVNQHAFYITILAKLLQLPTLVLFIQFFFFGRILLCNVTAVHGYFIHSYRWQHFAFLPRKLNNISPLLHITWNGVLGVSWEDDTCGCTGNCHIYVKWERKPTRCNS
jgi:hypothetical protein